MKLEPCPFCGSGAMLEAQFGREWWVQCSNMECNATSSAIEPTPQAAEDWWNRRASIPPITPVEAGKVGVAAGVTAVQAPSELWKATDALLNALTAYEIAQQGQSDQLQRFAAGLVAAKRRAGEALNAHGAAVGAKPCPYCDAPPGHAHSSSCPDGVLDRVGAVIAKATAGVAACGSSLSDAQCNQFRALPVSFNEMVRAIYAAGYAAGSIDEKERTAGVMASDGGQR